jgi:hypothetical protein
MDHKVKDGHFRKFWPELVQEDSVENSFIPPWRILEPQAVATRALMIAAVRKGDLPEDIVAYGPNHRRYDYTREFIPVNEFNIYNLHCFQYLPAVSSVREQYASAGIRAIRKSFARNAPTNDDETREQLLEDVHQQLRQEMAARMYHQALWRQDGRRVYVLDQTTFTLLAETPLPNLPASILSAPHHSFYLVYPPNCPSKFGIWDMWRQEECVQSMEGVFVSIDNIEPDSNDAREISFLNVGVGEGIGDRNIAYISVSLGPKANLADVRFQDAASHDVLVKLDTGVNVRTNIPNEPQYANMINAGAYDLGVITPRVILGFLLYLASEHPDIEPIPPAPRRAFKEIVSPKQREAAVRNENERLKAATRLPILYVGAHLREEMEHELDGILQKANTQAERQWILDHPVFVRGHWRNQPCGVGRNARRMIWIRPYRKGPDMADSMKIRASKVQRAQSVKLATHT